MRFLRDPWLGSLLLGGHDITISSSSAPARFFFLSETMFLFRPDEDQGNSGRNVVSDKGLCWCWWRGNDNIRDPCFGTHFDMRCVNKKNQKLINFKFNFRILLFECTQDLSRRPTLTSNVGIQCRPTLASNVWRIFGMKRSCNFWQTFSLAYTSIHKRERVRLPYNKTLSCKKNELSCFIVRRSNLSPDIVLRVSLAYHSRWRP